MKSWELKCKLYDLVCSESLKSHAVLNMHMYAWNIGHSEFSKSNRLCIRLINWVCIITNFYVCSNFISKKLVTLEVVTVFWSFHLSLRRFTTFLVVPVYIDIEKYVRVPIIRIKHDRFIFPSSGWRISL